MTDIEERIAKLLADLGATVDEVAATLRRLGVTGEPQCPSQCPIANYLASNGIPVRYVNSMRVLHKGSVMGSWGVSMPQATGDFVLAFDDSPESYPDLIEAL